MWRPTRWPGALIRTGLLSGSRRDYEHKTRVDLVPDGQQASKFQSSNNPKHRKENVKGLFFAPQTTERLTAVTVGINAYSPAELGRAREQLRCEIADALQIDASLVTLGLSSVGITRHHAMTPIRGSDVSELQPTPRWCIPVYLDEEEFDVETIAAMGNEIFLTIQEQSHDGLRRLGVSNLVPPRANMEGYVDTVLGDTVTPDEQVQIEARWNTKGVV